MTLEQLAAQIEEARWFSRLGQYTPDAGQLAEAVEDSTIEHDTDEADDLHASTGEGVALEQVFCYQRGLADYYVEYELFAYMDHPLNRVPVLSALHANIQDQFNTYGVQIMSPHFVVQPKDAVLVPTDGWYAAPAEPKQ